MVAAQKKEEHKFVQYIYIIFLLTHNQTFM